MKSIVVTYPNFQSLPKGIKMMLVMSESLFFRDAKTAPMQRRDGAGMTTSARNGGAAGKGVDADRRLGVNSQGVYSRFDRSPIPLQATGVSASQPSPT
jgi:hypothetical protein